MMPTRAAESVYAIGDSVVEGAHASTADKRFINRIATRRNWTVTSLAFGSAGVTDYALQSYPGFTRNGVASPDHLSNGQHSLLLAGYNDMRDWGANGAFLEHFQRTMGAIIAWLTIPDTQKVLAQSSNVIHTGSWTPSPVYGGTLASSSSTPGDTLQFQLGGTTLYLVYLSKAASATPFNLGVSGRPTPTGPEFAISIDGADFGVVDAHNAFGNRRAFRGDDSFEPALLEYAPHLLRLSGLNRGSHQVTVTVHSATNAMPATFVWGAGDEGFTNGIAGPDAWVGNTLTMTPEGYAQFSTNGSPEAVARFNQVLASVCSELYGDGLNVVLADCSAAYTPATGADESLVLPNDAGHEQISEAFLSRAELRFSLKAASPIEFRVALVGRYGANYDIQRSATLVDWSSLTQLQGGDQSTEWSLVVPSQEAKEFFRVIVTSALQQP